MKSLRQKIEALKTDYEHPKQFAPNRWFVRPLKRKQRSVLENLK